MFRVSSTGSFGRSPTCSTRSSCGSPAAGGSRCFHCSTIAGTSLAGFTPPRSPPSRAEAGSGSDWRSERTPVGRATFLPPATRTCAIAAPTTTWSKQRLSISRRSSPNCHQSCVTGVLLPACTKSCACVWPQRNRELALGGALQRLRELLECGAEVGNRLPDHPEHRAAVLLAHVESRLTVRCRRQRVGPRSLEQAQGHPTRPHHALTGAELGEFDWKGPPGVRFDKQFDRLAGSDLAVDLIDGRVPVGVVRGVSDKRPDALRARLDVGGHLVKLQLLPPRARDALRT